MSPDELAALRQILEVFQGLSITDLSGWVALGIFIWRQSVATRKTTGEVGDAVQTTVIAMGQKLDGVTTRLDRLELQLHEYRSKSLEETTETRHSLRNEVTKAVGQLAVDTTQKLAAVEARFLTLEKRLEAVEEKAIDALTLLRAGRRTDPDGGDD